MLEVAATDTPRSTSCGEQPRDQRGVARVVEFELVDAQQRVIAQQLDAFGETEHPGELGQLHERRKCLGVHGIVGQLTVGGGQQMRLADTETAVEVQPDAGQHLASAEQLLAAAAAFDGPLAEASAGGDGRRLGRLGRVGVIAREAGVGERRRRRQLGDKPLRRDGRLPVDQTSNPVHARTLSTCCNHAHG